MFHFTCFNVEDPHDSSVGLIDGQLSIPGNLLRREVFDPVVGEVRNFVLSPRSDLVNGCRKSQVLQLIEEQIRKLDQRIDALLLVGGFAGSEYLKQRVEVRGGPSERFSVLSVRIRNNSPPESESSQDPLTLIPQLCVVRRSTV